MATNTTTSYNYNSTQYPAWYTTFMENVGGRADALMDQPYQAYQGQRLADFTPDQMAAFQMVRDQQGNYQPYLNQATRLTEQGVNTDVLGGVEGILGSTLNTDFGGAAASGDNYLKQGFGTALEGVGLTRDAAQRQTAQTYDPYAQEALGYTRNAAAGNTLGLASPYVQNAGRLNGLAAAQPYLDRASTSFPEVAGAYMSPYTQGVTDRIADLGARNLREKLMPAISDDFIRSGQYGSTAQRDTVGRALRDTQEAVLGEQARSLEAGYGTAANIYGQDAGRFAGLAGTAGNLGLGQGALQLDVGRTLADVGGSDLERQMAAGQSVAGIGQFATEAQQEEAQRLLQGGQTLASTGTSLGSLGIQRGQLGLTAAQLQAANARDIAGLKAGIMSDAADRRIQGGAQMGVLGQQVQDQGYRGAAALENVGLTQQGLNQRNLDLGYGNFVEQRDYPWTNLGRASAIVNGQNVGATTAGGSTTTSPGPSTAQQVAGVGLGVAGLAGSGVFRAKGGAVKKPKGNHSYGNLPRRGLGAMLREAA